MIDTQLELEFHWLNFVAHQGDGVSKELREVKPGCCWCVSPLVGLAWSGVEETRTASNVWMKSTSARLTRGGFTLWTSEKPVTPFFDLKSACRTPEAVRPVKATVWVQLIVTPVMPSFCVYLRRGILRRYRQVPRTEADGAFNYSRASNRRGLLNSGRSDAKS